MTDTIRRKSVELFFKALQGNEGGLDNHDDRVHRLAESIEDQIFTSHDGKVDTAYKESVRSHISNLKDARNPLRRNVLEGKIDPASFAHMDSADMATADRRAEDSVLRRNSIRDSMMTNHIQPRERDLDDPEPDHQ